MFSPALERRGTAPTGLKCLAANLLSQIRMIESQVMTEDIQECASPIPETEKWQLSPEFETGEAEEIPVTQIPQKTSRRAVHSSRPQPIYSYAQAALAPTHQADQSIWLAICICSTAVLLISILKALAS